MKNKKTGYRLAVRTLDFHSKNEGSNPSSPTIEKFFNKKNIYFLSFIKNYKKVKYSFTFISLISPFLTNNLNFNTNKIIKTNKLSLKQSYIILSWFYYLSFLENKRNKKNKIKFFILPKKIKKFTNTKAPMAHKTFSKEQYQYKFFKIQITFISTLHPDFCFISLNQVFFFFF